MAEKNNTSSLLEAIKNKLSKFDNKPKPEAKSSVNYFSQDLQSKAIDGVIADKTNIGLIFEAEKKLEAIDKKNLNLERNRPKDLDLDLDDESLVVKNLGQKISIESKIKEIADELNLEEFEDDFEDDKNAEAPKKIVKENNYQNLDPIDIELMELEKEIAKNNQQNSQKNSEKEIAEDLNLKNYLDSKFEDEFKEIENKIKENQNAVNSDANKPEESSNEAIAQEEKIIDKIDSFSSSIINSSQINPFFSKDQFTFKATPAQDFLASMQNKSLEENVEKTEETSSENIVEKTEETSANSSENIVKNEVLEKPVEALNVNTPTQDFLASMPNKSEEETTKKSENSSENIVKNEVFEKPFEALNVNTPAQDFLASIPNKSSEENVEKTEETSLENIVEKNEETSANSPENIVENEVSEKPFEALNANTPAQDFLASMPNRSEEETVIKNSENFVKNEVFEKPVENLNKITQKNNSQFTKPSIINQKISTVENTKFNEFNNSKDSKLKIENSDPKNPIFEKVNYNLIREEAVFQASNSMKKLMEAKNLVNNVGNFARDETLTKIAVSLMEPKLEKWLNDNLPTLVENIVREEIEKIVPKN
jgi:cell pole-organizing protein PopZ